MRDRCATGDEGGDTGLTRVLLIDDSPTMRRLIRHTLLSDRRIAVVGEAGDATEAREQIKALRPDVLTLDVEMPGMSGLDFLRKLMCMRPMPVVMVSTETQRGSMAAVLAMSLGAVDCIGKPRDPGVTGAFARLGDALVAAKQAMVAGKGPLGMAQAPSCASKGPFRWNGRHVLIGASTGGVDALSRVLSSFPADCPPTIIVQHMPPSFLASFSQRLDGDCAPEVMLAAEGAVMRQGRVLIAPGGEAHLALSGGARTCVLVPGERLNGHRPSVDITFESALPVARQTVAALLTGMGRDGADGLRNLRLAGASTLAQDEATSVVWGMPRAAWEGGGAEELVPIQRMGARLLELCSRDQRASTAV